MDWATKEHFEKNLCAREQSRRTLIIPKIAGGEGYECVRLKILSEHEYAVMNAEYASLNGGEKMSVERVESMCKKYVYFFSSENSDLALAPGKLVAHWGRDPRVTSFQVNYSFAVAALDAHHFGFGCRHSVTGIGLNGYYKDCGTGSVRPHPSPLQADEDIPKQQYFRQTFKDQLVQPKLRKIVNQLAHHVSQVASSINPILMNKASRICTRKILTTGQVPKEQEPQPNLLPQGGVSKHPISGFANATHVDKRDRLSEEQVESWKSEAQQCIQAFSNKKRKFNKKKREQQYLLRLLDEKDICIPTTCGYQFVCQGLAEEELAQRKMDVHAFFAMDGLGVAMPIQHGVVQHFMGAMFLTKHAFLFVVEKMIVVNYI
jgi:hypothetical protein